MCFYRLLLFFNIIFFSGIIQASNLREEEQPSLRYEQVNYEHAKGCWEKVEYLPNPEWHIEQARKITTIQHHIQQFYPPDASKRPNIATFMIQVNYNFPAHFQPGEPAQIENHTINICWTPSFFLSPKWRI